MLIDVNYSASWLGGFVGSTPNQAALDRFELIASDLIEGLYPGAAVRWDRDYAAGAGLPQVLVDGDDDRPEIEPIIKALDTAWHQSGPDRP